jgi:phosphatidate cytidylyltransferase
VSETAARVAWALPWIAFAITVIVVGGGVFAAAMVILAWIGLAELSRMVRESRPLMPVALIVSAAMIAAAYWGTHLQIVLVGACAFPLMFLAAIVRRDRDAIVPAMAITVFGLAWIGVPFVHAVLLRELPEHGAGLLVNVLVATFLSDTAAYAGGRLFGRHRLAPSLSPNKTVEGLAAGFAGGTLAFWFAGLYQDWLPGIDALLMGACVAAIAPVGDLFASLVKRDLGVKDSGNVFGPHGGLIDRLDAVLFTIVVGYYLALAFVY